MTSSKLSSWLLTMNIKQMWQSHSYNIVRNNLNNKWLSDSSGAPIPPNTKKKNSDVLEI